MIRFFLDYTVQVVILGTLILGIVSGALGAFAMLRKQALLGDAISHAALPGICVAFLLTLNKSGWILLAGAAISGWIGTIVMMVITDYTSLKKDAALGIILSVFFGFGLMLLTFIQRLPTANQAGLNKFLFGSASTLLMSDVRHMAILGAITLAVLVLFWKEFKLLTFDVDFAQVLGFPTKRIQVALTTLIVIAIVIGLQTVGVVLMSAMLIAPAAAARQWTDSLSKMVVLSSFFGAISGAAGSIISSLVYRLPTGPVIVLIMSLFVLLSLLFAPNRGILWELPLFKKFATAKSKNEPSERGETKYNSPEPKRKGIYFPEAGFIRDEPSERGETI
ncbi:metal ABC transporter permease [bacterium]|nr:metal ABC transporter permease [bacterium]